VRAPPPSGGRCAVVEPTGPLLAAGGGRNGPREDGATPTPAARCGDLQQPAGQPTGRTAALPAREREGRRKACGVELRAGSIPVGRRDVGG
jgi:hypothetical protein